VHSYDLDTPFLFDLSLFRVGDIERSLQSEDFETSVTGISECLLIRKYGFAESMSPQAMLIWIHGDVSSGGPANYHFALAERTAYRYADGKVVSVALVRPGYPDGSGNESSGNNGRSDHYTRENIGEVGGVVEKLRLRYKPNRVILVGHSGGAAIAAALMGMKPGLAEAAILAACPCELISWRKHRRGRPWTQSENPIGWVDKVSPSAKVIALTGSKDDDTLPVLAKSYVDALLARGVDATFQVVPNETHNGVIGSLAVLEAIAKIVVK
jgi:pimeloyl-ACP methyl ester carboxylesterase